MLNLVKVFLLTAIVAVGSRGPLKYTSVTKSKVRKDYWEASATYPKFQASSAVSRLTNHTIAEFSEATLNDWTTNVTKDMEKPPNPWSEETTPVVITATPDLISLEIAQYSYSGGAHPNTQQLAFNFGMVKGKAKRLTLTDLFKPGTKPLAIVSKIVIAKLREKNASWIQDGTVKALDAKSGDEFLIKSDRLDYIFSPYEMGSYAEGPYEVEVPFAALEPKLDPNGPLKDLLRKL